jgi:hypothetical protein
MMQQAHPVDERRAHMFRTFSFALATMIAIGTTALAPASASAWGFHGSPHGGFGFHGGFREGWGLRGWGDRGHDGGPGWCYFHPLRCEGF